jgi:hypothetical protein
MGSTWTRFARRLRVCVTRMDPRKCLARLDRVGSRLSAKIMLNQWLRMPLDPTVIACHMQAA